MKGCKMKAVVFFLHMKEEVEKRIEQSMRQWRRSSQLLLVANALTKM